MVVILVVIIEIIQFLIRYKPVLLNLNDIMKNLVLEDMIKLRQFLRISSAFVPPLSRFSYHMIPTCKHQIIT